VKVHLYEKAWMALSLVILVMFASTVVFTAVAHGIHPPSQVETIDPLQCRTDPRFVSLGVAARQDGGADVTMLAQIWVFLPAEVRVPAGRPVTFRLTSPDVIHGFQVVGTNVNAMVIPGYVTQVTTTFQRAGEYLAVCNEYCGAGHHVMASKVVVEEAAP
jgi:cytochrome c oxidase subunit 2